MRRIISIFTVLLCSSTSVAFHLPLNKEADLSKSTNTHNAFLRQQREREQRNHDMIHSSSSSSLQMVDLASSTMLMLSDSSVSPEPIHTAFTVANFFPQPFWLLIILLPNWQVTKKIMGGLDIVLLCCLVHFFIVTSSIVLGGEGATAPLAEFNDVFDPFGDPQKAFIGMVSNYPNFVAEEWSHVLTWDLFIGRYIWLDGLKRGIFTSHSVLFANLIGPPGLLLHWFTCSVFYGKPILEQEELEQIEKLN